MPARQEKLLSDCPPGTIGTVLHLGGGNEFHARMASMGVIVGSRLKVIRRHGRNGPCLISVGETRIAIGRGMAEKIDLALSDPEASELEAQG